MMAYSEYTSKLCKAAHSSGIPFCVSPKGLWTIFISLREGSEGVTRNELTSLVGSRIINLFPTKSNYDGMTYGLLVCASPLCNLDPAFIQSSVNEFNAEIVAIDADIDKTVNSWISRLTDGHIVDMQLSLNSDCKIILVSALYFKGVWLNPFNQAFTSRERFMRQDGSSDMIVMMFQNEAFHTGFNSALKSDILVLPYSNLSYQLVIVLPKIYNQLDQVIENLTGQVLDELLLSIDKLPYQEVDVFIPKFQISIETTMNDIVCELGCESLFKRCDLTKICKDKGFRLSAIEQKTVFAVDERGTTAASVTAGICSDGPTSKKFVANHPFLFLLLEKAVPVFIGTYHGL